MSIASRVRVVSQFCRSCSWISGYLGSRRVWALWMAWAVRVAVCTWSLRGGILPMLLLC